jgi:glucokinase
MREFPESGAVLDESHRRPVRVLAGDAGGTHTRLALFENGSSAASVLEVYPSQEFQSLFGILSAFRERHPGEVRAACFGVAGPVREHHARISNLTWEVDGPRLADALGLDRVDVVNDVEAAAHGLSVLAPSDFAVLNEGDPEGGGNQALIASGTGLGEAGLIWEGTRYRPFASEGGHADYAPRTEIEAELLLHLGREYARVSFERVVSGPGLFDIYRFLKRTGRAPEPHWLEEEIREAPDPSPVISRHALSKNSELCVRALEIFVANYGAEAGNLALKLLATAGLFVGGGIAPKILPVLREGGFMSAFLDKGRMRPLLEKIPVRVVTRKETSLLGAALLARERAEAPP